MTKETDFWDKQAKRFEKQAKKDDEEFSLIVGKISAFLNKDDLVLDYACGIGTSSIKMSDYVKEIHAIDISSGMIEVAKKRSDLLGISKINFEQSLIFNTDFKKEKYNVITAFNILHLVQNNDNVIARIHELLMPGGLFISSTPCLGESGALIRFIFKIISKITKLQHLQFLKLNDVEQLITQQKFEIISKEKLTKPADKYFAIAKKI